MLHGWLIDPQHPISEVIGQCSHDELQDKLLQLTTQSSSSTNSVTRELMIRDFIQSTQLTEYGLAALHDAVLEDELVVFFRNNHFSTVTKHQGQLFNLVTDIGYEKERLVVWDLLSNIDGNSCFYSSDFLRRDKENLDEIKNTATLYGFTPAQVDSAIQHITQLTQELRLDDVLAFLQQHYLSSTVIIS